MAIRQKLSVAIILITFGILVYLLSPVLKPLYIALLLAYITNPLVQWLTRWNIPRTAGTLLVFVLVTITIALLIGWLLPPLIKQINIVIEKIPATIDWSQQIAIPWLNEHLSKDMQINLDNTKAAIVNSWHNSEYSIASIIKTITHSGVAVIGWLVNLIIVPVVVFYLLRDWPQVIKAIHKLLPRRIEPTAFELARESNDILGAFFRGQLLVMICLGAIYATGLWIMDLNLALLIGLIAGLLSIVPYLGTFIGILAALIAAYFQFGSYIHLVYVLIVFGVGHALEGMIFTPLLVGDRIGLHPVAVIFAVLIGTYLFGFMGALLALPAAAVMMVLVRYTVKKYYKSELYNKL